MTFFNNIIGPLPFQNLRWVEGGIIISFNIDHPVCIIFLLAVLVKVCDFLRFFEFYTLGNAVWEKIIVA